MPGLLANATDRVRRGIMQRAMARGGSASGSPDLSSLRRVPKRATYALRRDTIHPVQRMREVQAKEPVTRLARLLGMNVWLVTGYDEAKVVLADGKAYSNNIRHLLGDRDQSGAEGVGGLGMTDPPMHTKLRGMLTPEFTRRRLSRLDPLISRVVAETLEQMATNGPEADLVTDFGFLIPFRVISELLGLPEIDFQRFHELGAARFDVSEGGGGSFGAATSSREFLIAEVARQRTDPGEGLIAAMIRDFGDEFDDVDLGGVADGVLLGGYETSASMLVMSTFLLSSQPEAWETLRSGTEEEISAIIEELLRMLTPVQIAFARFAREDHDLFGKRIRKGDPVLVSLVAANRDPKVFAKPDTFDPHRQANSQLAFGHGMHRCLGAELGKMELKAALCGIATRFPDLALIDAPQDIAFRELSIVYGVDSLRVRLW